MDYESAMFAVDAEELYNNGKYQEALSLCESGIQQYTDYASGYIIALKSAIKLNDYDKADSILKNANKKFRKNKVLIALSEELKQLKEEKNNIIDELSNFTPPIVQTVEENVAVQFEEIAEINQEEIIQSEDDIIDNNLIQELDVNTIIPAEEVIQENNEQLDNFLQQIEEITEVNQEDIIKSENDIIENNLIQELDINTIIPTEEVIQENNEQLDELLQQFEEITEVNQEDIIKSENDIIENNLIQELDINTIIPAEKVIQENNEQLDDLLQQIEEITEVNQEEIIQSENDIIDNNLIQELDINTIIPAEKVIQENIDQIDDLLQQIEEITEVNQEENIQSENDIIDNNLIQELDINTILPTEEVIQENIDQIDDLPQQIEEIDEVNQEDIIQSENDIIDINLIQELDINTILPAEEIIQENIEQIDDLPQQFEEIAEVNQEEIIQSEDINANISIIESEDPSLRNQDFATNLAIKLKASAQSIEKEIPEEELLQEAEKYNFAEESYEDELGEITNEVLQESNLANESLTSDVPEYYQKYVNMHGFAKRLISNKSNILQKHNSNDLKFPLESNSISVFASYSKNNRHNYVGLPNVPDFNLEHNFYDENSLENINNDFGINFNNTKIEINEFDKQDLYENEDNDDSKQEIITDTIANILMMQGAYKQAKEAFEDLALKNPDKADYYNQKIQEIENKII